MRVPKTGGTTSVVANVPYGLSSLHLYGQYIYAILQEKELLDGNSIVRISTSTGNLERLAGTSCTRGRRIQVADGFIYYDEGSEFIRIDLEGRNTAVIKIQGASRIALDSHDLAIQGNTVFELDGDGKIYKNAIRQSPFDQRRNCFRRKAQPFRGREVVLRLSGFAERLNPMNTCLVLNQAATCLSNVRALSWKRSSRASRLHHRTTWGNLVDAA